MSATKTYNIQFGVLNREENELFQNKVKIEIPINNIQIGRNFEFKDYSSYSSLENIKEFYLKVYCKGFMYCKCMLYLYYKDTNRFRLISKNDKQKIRDFNLIDNKLYLIKTKSKCNCEYYRYIRYMSMNTFDIISSFKNKIDELENKIYKLQKYDEINIQNRFKYENFYDIIIDINSVRKVSTNGWKVIFNENGLNKYNKYKDQDLIIIGVIGNNNKGKSFLLSKISKIKLLTGASIETKGLSVKYPELKGYKGRQIILLDSAGLETPVFKTEKEEKEEIKIDENNEFNIIKEDDKEQENNEELINNKNENEEIEKEEENKIKKNKIDKEIEDIKEFRENSSDKIITELFLENFIIKVSDILLIVVGKLTYSEQKLINKIKVESKKQNKSRIIIIHNLQEYRAIEQVQDYIKNNILKWSTFNLKKRKNITTKKDSELNIINNKYIINKEYKINKKEIINEINNIIDINDENIEDESVLIDVHFTEILNYNDGKKLEIYHLILANEDSEAGEVYNKYAYDFIENIYNIITEQKKFDIFEEVKDKFKNISDVILADNIEKIPFTETEKIIKDKIIKLEYNKELTLKRCYTDELGFSLFKSGNVELKYNYFKPDENTLELRVELPGTVECFVDHKVIGEDTIITLTGNKYKDKQPKEPNYNIYNIREFGDFELNIRLKVEDYKITSKKPKEGYPKFVNGVCLIQYELSQKAEQASAKVDSEL